MTNVGSEASGQVLLTHAVGLHARPSVKLTKLAKTFGATIELGTGAGRPVDRRQEHRQGHGGQGAAGQLHFRAAGNDARDAVAALIGLVERDFDEAQADAANG